MKKRIAINGLLDWDGETKGSNRQAESKLVQFWSFDRRFGTTTLAFHDFFAKYHDMKISINVRAPRNHPCLMGFFIASHPLGVHRGTHGYHPLLQTLHGYCSHGSQWFFAFTRTSQGVVAANQGTISLLHQALAMVVTFWESAMAMGNLRFQLA
jgi:hypothetical protein